MKNILIGLMAATMALAQSVHNGPLDVRGNLSTGSAAQVNLASSDKTRTVKEASADPSGSCVLADGWIWNRVSNRLFGCKESAQGSGVYAWTAEVVDVAQITGTLPTAKGGTGSTTLTFPAGTETVVGRATTDTLTNKTLTLPIIGTYTVATLPAAATVGRLAVVTDSGGANCTSGGGSTRVWCRDTGSAWELIGGAGAGGGTTQYQADGTNVGSPRGTLDVITGSGITWSLVDTGTKVTATASVDTAVIATRANVQSAASIRCAGTGTAAAQTCNLTPALTAYTTGMVISYRPGTTNVTTQTLAINGLAAVSILKHDGTALAAGDLTSGRDYLLTYDGAAFDLAPSGAGGGAVTTTDAYWPWPVDQGDAHNPGAGVFRVFSFTPAMTISPTKIALIGSGTGYVAGGIYLASTGARVANASFACQTAGTGNGMQCSFAGAFTLTAGTRYRLGIGADASTGYYATNLPGLMSVNNGTNTGFVLAGGYISIGTSANGTTGSGATLASPATLGTISSAPTFNVHNAYPVAALLP